MTSNVKKIQGGTPELPRKTLPGTNFRPEKDSSVPQHGESILPKMIKADTLDDIQNLARRSDLPPPPPSPKPAGMGESFTWGELDVCETPGLEISITKFNIVDLSKKLNMQDSLGNTPFGYILSPASNKLNYLESFFPILGENCLYRLHCDPSLDAGLLGRACERAESLGVILRFVSQKSIVEQKDVNGAVIKAEQIWFDKRQGSKTPFECALRCFVDIPKGSVGRQLSGDMADFMASIEPKTLNQFFVENVDLVQSFLGKIIAEMNSDIDGDGCLQMFALVFNHQNAVEIQSFENRFFLCQPNGLAMLKLAAALRVMHAILGNFEKNNLTEKIRNLNKCVADKLQLDEAVRELGNFKSEVQSILEKMVARNGSCLMEKEINDIRLAMCSLPVKELHLPSTMVQYNKAVKFADKVYATNLEGFDSALKDVVMSRSPLAKIIKSHMQVELEKFTAKMKSFSYADEAKETNSLEVMEYKEFISDSEKKIDEIFNNDLPETKLDSKQKTVIRGILKKYAVRIRDEVARNDPERVCNRKQSYLNSIFRVHPDERGNLIQKVTGQDHPVFKKFSSEIASYEKRLSLDLRDKQNEIDREKNKIDAEFRFNEKSDHLKKAQGIIFANLRAWRRAGLSEFEKNYVLGLLWMMENSIKAVNTNLDKLPSADMGTSREKYSISELNKKLRKM
ncbi:hypothetical protein QS306_11045 [Paraburkholderia bonniea]|uniref:hypothetical protein n=1 Tax=Paraburkholderia bonniea TaxID=2152891 RepID=UPI002574127B|nr:hypothetical protein [Paraburkholderia bonniea]WJF89639.1 hypothetical protein QS306_11045 [Paraburkholderia bonniea]WJF92953.1 hypothetical protein QS308_11055 [Paraburkholderia bonniea]